MKNNTRKILIALMLVFAVLMSFASVSAFAAEEATDDGKNTIYFQNNWLWTDVKCHYWGSATENDTEWPGVAMTEVGTQDDYQVFSLDVPTDIEGLIISGVKNDGSGSRDQTPDIKDGIVDGAGWSMVWVDGNDVVPFTYVPGSEPVELTYTVAGTEDLCTVAWDPSVSENDLSLNADGTYSKTYENVPAGEHKFKVAKNHSWAHAWPASDYVLNLTVASDVTITFNPETNQVGVSHVPAGETPVDPPVNPPVDPGTGEEGGLTGDYYLAGWINGADYGIVADAANLGIYKFVDGQLTVNFTSDSYVIVKNGDNVGYWAMEYCENTTVTLYNQSTGAGEKMKVPAGQVTFTLTQGEGDTLVLSYNGGGAGSLPSTPTEPADDPIQPENGYYKIYVYNTSWWDLVCYYVWNDAGEVRQEWPGQEVYEDTYLLYPVMIPADYSSVIFNDGGSNQTVDIPLNSIDKSKIVYNNATGEWMAFEDYDPTLEVEKPELPEPPNYDEYDKVKVYLGNSAGWSAANWYAWSDETGAFSAWPGTPMEYDDILGMYYAEVPVCFTKIIFNDGTNQTANLLLPALTDSKVVCDNTIGAGAAGGSELGDGVSPWFTLDEYEVPEPILPPDWDVTVVVKNDAGWDEVYFYYFGGDNSVEWPGMPMEIGEDGLYYGIVPAGSTNVVFNNGGHWEDGTLLQSADLRVPTDDNILFNNSTNEWSYFEIETPDDPIETPDDPEEKPEENPEEKPEDKPTENPDDSAEKLNFFQKIWKAILDFFRKLFGKKD